MRFLSLKVWICVFLAFFLTLKDFLFFFLGWRVVGFFYKRETDTLKDYFVLLLTSDGSQKQNIELYILLGKTLVLLLLEH